MKIKGRAEQTIKSYHYHNKYFMKFLEKDVYCDEITLGTLEDYILYIKEKKGYILENFLIPEVKEQEVIKEIYTNEELHDLLEKPKKMILSK